jgi:hypothetical protein
MSSLLKFSLISIGVIAVAGGLLVFSVVRYHRSGPPAQERHVRDLVLKPLLQAHATREQVVQSLGLEFVDYSAGSTNRLSMKRAFYDKSAYQRAERYPGVLFHTTAMTMTWLFFDADGRLQDYYLCEQ